MQNQIPFSGFSYATRDLLIPPTYANLESKRTVGMTSGASGTAYNFAVGAQSRCYHMTGTAEAPFDAVRLMVLSLDSANTVTGASAAFAPTSRIDGTVAATAGSIITPTGSWSTFQWSASGTFNMPTGTATSFGTLTSDWLPVSCINRADIAGPGPYYFMCRIQLPPGAGTFVFTRDNTGGVTFDTDANLSIRRFFRAMQQNIDGVATPALFTQTAQNTGYPAAIIQFRSRGRVFSMMNVGDSIAEGVNSSDSALGYGLRTQMAVSQPNVPLQIVNCGRGSQSSTDYLANAKTLITLCTPQIATYSVWSPNDGTLTQAISDTQMAQAMDFIQHCRANSCLPILLTPTPVNTDTAAISALKQSLQARINDMARRGVLVADMYAAVTDFTARSATGGYPWLPGYYADATHPNDTGHTAMQQVLMPVIQLALNANS